MIEFHFSSTHSFLWLWKLFMDLSSDESTAVVSTPLLDCPVPGDSRGNRSVFYQFRSVILGAVSRICHGRSAAHGNLLASHPSDQRWRSIWVHFWSMACTRHLCTPISMHLSGLWSWSSHVLLQRHPGRRLPDFPLESNTGRRPARRLTLHLVAGAFLAPFALAGCSVTIPVHHLSVIQQTPLEKTSNFPHLAMAWVWMRNPVAKIQTSREPVLQWGTRAHPSPVHLPETHHRRLFAAEPFHLPVSVKTNPWHCIPAAPPCTATSKVGQDWWRCTKKILKATTKVHP